MDISWINIDAKIVLKKIFEDKYTKISKNTLIQLLLLNTREFYHLSPEIDIRCTINICGIK